MCPRDASHDFKLAQPTRTTNSHDSQLARTQIGVVAGGGKPPQTHGVKVIFQGHLELKFHRAHHICMIGRTIIVMSTTPDLCL